MKILIISPYIPWPLYSGSCVRIFNLLKRLSLDGHEIFLLVGNGDALSITDPELSKLCKKIYMYKTPGFSRIFSILYSIFSPKIFPAVKFQSKNFIKVLNEILAENKINVVWVNFLFMADMLPFDLKKTIPVILDQHESERLLYRGYIKNGTLAEKFFAVINIVKLKKFEERVFSKISMLACVSHTEAEIAEKYATKGIKILVVPNGVDEKFFNDFEAFNNKENRIIFCANMAVRRNIEAAVWFAKDIFTKIKERISDAEFWIIGSWPNKEVLALSSIPRVHVVGMVEDITKYYRGGRVFVAPYHFAAGSPLKVLEAMASGIPVVSTDVSSKGIGAINDKNIIIANNEKDFCDGVVNLLSDPVKAKELAVSAQNFIREKYTWEKIVAHLESEIYKLVLNK